MMEYYSFSWDEKKNTLNKNKHNVSFEEAKTVFYDDNAIDFFDIDHSENEDRFLLLGLSGVNFNSALYCKQSFLSKKLIKWHSI